MKALISSLIMLLICLNHAYADIESCKTDANFFGSHTQSVEPAAFCYNLFKTDANNQQIANSEDNLVKTFGLHNILYIDTYQLDTNNNPVLFYQGKFAGDQTYLNDIQAINFNDQNKWISVLNIKDGIKYSLQFNSIDDGNVAPIRMFTSDLIQNASSVTSSSTSNKVIFASKDSQWIRVFNLNADDRFKGEYYSKDLVAEISGANTEIQSPVAIDIHDLSQEAFILDNDRILVFNISNTGDVAPIRVIQGSNTTLSSAKDLKVYNSQIHIINGDDSEVLFNLTDDGNSPPLP